MFAPGSLVLEPIERMQRLAVALLALALVVFMVGGPEARPILRSASPTASVDAAVQAKGDGIDVDGVVSAVRHRVVPDGAGTLVAEGDRYRASFDAGGFEVAGRDGDGLRVSTTRIAVGGTAAKVAAGPWHGRANVAERSLGADVVERVTADAHQVEWDVVLGARPAGTGDLRIEADATGASGPPQARPDGLRWDLGRGRSIVMGELVVEDRSGAELFRATPQARPDGISLTVPAAVLADADYPVTVDPTVGPERPVADPAPDPVPVSGPSEPGLGETTDHPAIAFDGANYLVAWVDQRDLSAGPQIFAARVTPTGEVLDHLGIVVSDDASRDSGPAVAFDGTNFLVVWADHGSGDGRVEANRVSRAGEVLDGRGFVIADAADTSNAPAVAFDGTNFFVVWGAGDIFAARVSPAGTLLDPEAIAIAARPTVEYAPAVAFDGSNHLVVWADGFDVFDIIGARVTPEGVVLDGDGIPIATGPATLVDPAVSFDGTNHLVVWAGFEGESSELDIFAARVSPAGAVLDPAPIAVTTLPGAQSHPAVAFDGTNHLVVWVDSSFSGGIDAARVSPAGAVLDPGGTHLGGRPSNAAPGVAFDGTHYLVALVGLEAVRVTTAGTPPDEPSFAVATSANGQYAPAVAFDGTNYLVVYGDNRREAAGTYGARVSRNGRILDADGFFIQGGGRPDVAFDGTNYLVVSDDGLGNVEGRLVSPAGEVLRRVFGRGLHAERPVVTFDGVNHLVAWWRFEQSASCPDDRGAISVARISPAGELLDEFDAGCNATNLAPAIAGDGRGRSLVVWTTPGSQIRGAMIGRSGTVPDPAGIPISTGPSRARGPSVASDGTRYLVAWTVDRPDGSDVMGARVSRSGIVRDPEGIPISTAPGGQGVPDVASNGRFLVVWIDTRSQDVDFDVYGTRVTGAGAVLDPEGVPIATGATRETSPRVIAGPGRRYSVVYQRYAPEAPYASERVFLRQFATK